MKITISALFAVLIFACQSKAETNDVSFESSKIAIQSAIRQANWCYTNAVVVHGKTRGFNRKTFALLLRDVDVSKCPREYRLAWSDFVFYYQQWVHGSGSRGLDAIVGIAELASPATAWAGVKKISDTDKADKAGEAKYRESLHQIERVVIQYDLDLHRITACEIPPQ